jgi:hypothetical protein
VQSFFSCSHDVVIRVHEAAGNVIETHEHAGQFKEPRKPNTSGWRIQLGSPLNITVLNSHDFPPHLWDMTGMTPQPQWACSLGALKQP